MLFTDIFANTKYMYKEKAHLLNDIFYVML